MSDTINSLNNKTQPIPIKYSKSCHGFSDSNNDTSRYLFELVISDHVTRKKYFRNLEEIKYSHLITLDHKIKLSNIKSYKASVSIYPSEIPIIHEIEGEINQYESSSTQNSDNLYIEFTKNDMGFTLCSCFYTGLDQNNFFVSPPN
jgi:hypothetical protein